MIVKRADRRRQTIIIVIVTIGIAISLLNGGAYAHYFLLIAPFLSLFSIAAVEKPLRSRLFFVSATVTLLTVVTLALRPVYWEYRVLATRVAAGEALSHGSAYEIADFVESLRLPDYTIFLMSEHILYWLLDKRPPTRIAHPAVLFYPTLLSVVIGTDSTPKTEIAAIFDQVPTVVVKREVEWYTRDFPGERQYIEQRLENYELVRVIDERRIYLIKDTLPDGAGRAG